MKLIAQTIKGYEYMHSKELAFFVQNASADKICKIMNDVRFRLKNENEIYHIYEYDSMQDYYVMNRLSIYKGVVKLKAL